MEDREIRAALDRHWAASDANDLEGEHKIYRVLWLGRGDHEPGEIGQSIRIGISRDANRLLRFYLRDSPFVSGPRSLKE